MIIGGGKKGFCHPHPNYWGARARAAPHSLRLCTQLGMGDGSNNDFDCDEEDNSTSVVA